MRKLAQTRELHGKVWVNTKGRQQVGLLIGAKAAHVSVGEGGAAGGCRGRRVGRGHCWLACHQT